MMDGETKTMTMHNRIREAALAAAAICAVLLMPAPAGAWPWAESVIIYNPGPGIWQGVYRDHTRILGRPWGAGVNAPDNSSVVTLGDGGTVTVESVSYTHLRAHETPEHLVCRLLLEKKNHGI